MTKHKPKTVMHYEVSVWNHEGDVDKKLWDASDEELEELRKELEGEPLLTLVIDRYWEAAP